MIGPSEVTSQNSDGPHVTRIDLLAAFLKIGLLGFGGVAPWARHVIVDERRWLSERDYAALLGVGQAMPGANTVNAAVMIGDRFQGFTGALISLAALMALPLVILIGVATLYDRLSGHPLVDAAIGGAAAAAAGLVVGTAVRMIRSLGLAPLALMIGALAFGAIGVLGWPLVGVLAALIPLSMAVAVWELRR